MPEQLTQKQELFALNFVKLGNASQAAIVAGYAPDYAGTNCDKLLKNTNVAARIKQLQTQIADDTIADVRERKRKLTEIIRKGDIRSEDISPGHVTTAISELNKMERVYDTAPTTNVDNRVINIYVRSERTRELLGKVKERTGKLIEGEARELPPGEPVEAENDDNAEDTPKSEPE